MTTKNELQRLVMFLCSIKFSDYGATFVLKLSYTLSVVTFVIYRSVYTTPLQHLKRRSTFKKMLHFSI